MCPGVYTTQHAFSMGSGTYSTHHVFSMSSGANSSCHVFSMSSGGLHHIPCIFRGFWGLHHTTCILHGSWGLKHMTCAFHVFWELNSGRDTCNARTLQTELSVPLPPTVHFKSIYLPYPTQVMNHPKSDIENPGRKEHPPAATSIAWFFDGLQESIQWNQHVGCTFLSLEKHTLVSSLILFINIILFLMSLG